MFLFVPLLLCSLFGDFWRRFVPPLFSVPPNAPALRALHLAGRAIVLAFLFIGFRWRWVCSLCRRSQNELCAWANERELFDTFPGFGARSERRGFRAVRVCESLCRNFTSFERALHCQFNCRRSDVPTSGFSLFFFHLLFLAVGYAGQPAPQQ